MQNEGFRYRLHRQLNRLRRKRRDLSNHDNFESTPRPQKDLTLKANQHVPPGSQHVASTTNTPSGNRSRESDAAQIRNGNSRFRTVVHTNGLEQNGSAAYSTLSVESDMTIVSLDIWSTAYREAVDSLGEEINVAILKGENVAHLLKQLEEIEKESTQESVFLRGVKYLHSLQVPLERFKLALDLASPLTNIEPTSATVFGMVRSVTAIAISFAAADLEFAKQVGEMLEQISYIDDCDTLGQKANKIDIHNALVSVYQKLLEFYNVAYEILTRKGAKLVMKMVLENCRLPNIVEEFLKHADFLRKLVQKATWEIVEDIKAMLYDREIARWLGSGKMSQQRKHHIDLRNLRADQACEFLLVDTKFVTWYQSPISQQLVILGDTGSGKSVSMAFLVDELSRRNSHQLPQPKVCYHYCRDDETGQAIYIFSSLLLSLLEQFSGLKRTFFEWYKQAGASGNFEPSMDMTKLEEFLQKILKTLDRPLFIVIDGLDECDRASQNSVLKSVKMLLQKTPRLKIILSCRPQVEILEQLDGIAKIDLVSDTERDRVIVEKTVEMKLFSLTEDVRSLVTETISRRAQGSAIWTKMIVELIEVRRIRALDPMRDFLDEMPLPEQLSELYAILFSRCTSNDPENHTVAITALKVLAVTRRPLSILELAWAVALGAAQKGVSTVAALAKLVDHERVMSLIQPFVAQVDFGDVKKRQVRFVHQSVKEFVVRKYDSIARGSQGPAISTDTKQGLTLQLPESLEAFILDICVKYLLLDDFGHTDVFTEEQLAIEELPQEFDLFSDDKEPINYDPQCTWESWEENMIRYDPTDRGFGELFVYTSCHWLEHFGSIVVEPLPGLENIETLCQRGSTRLHNWIKQYSRPECTIQPRFSFNSTLYDPLSITSLYGSEAMLRDMLERSAFNTNNFLHYPAMGAADQILQWGDLSRLRILITGSEVGHQLQNFGFFRLIMKQWSISGTNGQDWNVVFDLIDYVVDTLVVERWGNELLCIAAHVGCMPIIQRLMERAGHNAELSTELLRGDLRESRFTSFGKPVHQSIGEAVLGNHVNLVEYLLAQQGIESHLQHRNSHGENVLHLASRLCNPTIFGLLVPRFKEGIHQIDNQGETALVRIIKLSSTSRDRYESAQILLLEGGAIGEGCTENDPQDPLRIAARVGDLDMCRILIEIGKMNPLSALRQDDNGQLVLRDESYENELNVFAILSLLRGHANAASTPNATHFHGRES